MTSLPPDVADALAAPAPGVRVTIEGAGVPFSALTWGEAGDRPLVLIHGVTASAAIWWRVGPALAAPARRVVAPSWSSMVSTCLPSVGIRPVTLVLLDPPTISLGQIVRGMADEQARMA